MIPTRLLPVILPIRPNIIVMLTAIPLEKNRLTFVWFNHKYAFYYNYRYCVGMRMTTIPVNIDMQTPANTMCVLNSATTVIGSAM